MRRPVRFGVIGTGVGAILQAKAMNLMAKEELIERVAVASAREEKARSFADEWGFEAWYTRYSDLLKRQDIDVVSISTPHFLHAPMTIEAAEAGKHVLVDKPMATTLKEADDMIAATERTGVKLGVVFQGRFDPSMQRLKNAIEENKLGKLILGDASVKWFRTQEYYADSPWRGIQAREGGGALINQAIHYIDLLQWYLGPVDRFWSQVDTVAHEIEVEDLAVALLRFKNRAMGVIQGSTATYPGFPPKLEIHGTEGAVLIEGETIKRWVAEGKEEVTNASKQGLESWARPEAVPPTNHAELIKDFVEAVAEDRDPYVSGEEGRKSLEIITATYRSGRTGNVQVFPFAED